MSAHPPHKSKESTTVQCSDSISQTLKRHRRRPSSHQPKPRETKNKKSEESQLDLSGSDIAPPSIFVKRSIRLVEAWLEDCEKAVDRDERGGAGSMISLWGVGVVERPALDVGAYRPVKRRGMSRLSSLRSIFKPSSTCSGKLFEPPEVRDCVYEKAEQTLKKDLVEEINQGSGRKKKMGIGRVRRHFQRKKKEEEEDSMFFMAGGRSPGLSTSLETLVPQSDNGSSRRSSSTESDVGYCLYRDHDRHCSTIESDVKQARSRNESKASSKSRGPVKYSSNRDKIAHSSLSASPSSRYLSGDDTIHQTVFHTKRKPEITSHCTLSTSTSISTMSSPGSDCSRISSFNIGSIIERSKSSKELEERERRERLKTEIDRTPSPVPFRPSTPRPIQTERVRSWASIPLRRKPSIENLKPIAPEPAGNGYTSPKSTPASQPPAIIPVRKPGPYFKEQMAMPGVVGPGIQAFVVNRERRADRNLGGTGEFVSDQGQQADIDKEMDVFRRNRERRRVERQSAGRVMEAGTVGGVISEGTGVSGGQRRRSAGEEKKDFNVDEEPVASGIAWERRMKKGQSPAKKSPSEKYREEERAKYWSPK
ncbi:hypothetical protein N431DRAFT_548381 [Stipitochalara longipes BDJ]|nr:hypothetical protein N431DRAFT_548381 [Stipitochalara longipes BDJ]